MNQTRYEVSHWCLKSKTERIFRIACLEKSSYFNRKYQFFRLLFAYFVFKNIELSSGQGAVQIKPNLLWSIPWVPRV